MNPSNRKAFTLIEITVVSLLVVIIGGVLVTALGGARRTEEVAAYWLNLQESLAIAVHHLRTDVRQMSIVPGQRIDQGSLKIDGGAQELTLRRSVMPQAGKVGSQFTYVSYSLVPAKGESRFHIARREFTASGAPLPGRAASEDVTVYRSFQVRDLSFNFVEDDAKDQRVLTVGVTVVSDSGRRKQVGTAESVQFISNRIQVMRPLRAVDPLANQFFAAQVLINQPDIPPADVLAPGAIDSRPPPPPGVD